MKRILILSIIVLAIASCGSSKKGQSKATETYSVTHEELWLSKGGQKIYGVLYRPEGVQKAPVIIVSHGFGSSHRFGIAYAEALAPLGYAVYIYDFCGGGNFCKSDGKTTEMSICSEIADLEAVISGLQKLNGIDPERIILVGESQGGMVSALTAGAYKNLIEKLILIYPAFCIKDDWVKQYPQGSDVPETINLWGTTIGRGYIECLYGLEVYEAISKYEGPVYIFHGDKDQVVALSYAERAQKEYKNARLKVLDGEGHGFTPAGQSAVLEIIKKFLKEN